MVRAHDHIGNLEVVTCHLAAGKADNPPEVVCDPPGAIGLGQLLVKELPAPRRVRRALVGRRLEGDHGVEVVHAHGSQLEMTVGEGLVHARDLETCGRDKAKALAFVLLASERRV